MSMSVALPPFSWIGLLESDIGNSLGSKSSSLLLHSKIIHVHVDD